MLSIVIKRIMLSIVILIEIALRVVMLSIVMLSGLRRCVVLMGFKASNDGCTAFSTLGESVNVGIVVIPVSNKTH
jgi:hypothetical protein